jgi:hypothetical protein
MATTCSPDAEARAGARVVLDPALEHPASGPHDRHAAGVLLLALGFLVST